MAVAWSFSSLTQYRNCPKQYHEVRFLKNFKEVKGEEALWGDRVHKSIEKYLTDGTPLLEGMDVWLPILEPFRKLRGILHVENQLAITAGFQPCAWFAKDTWCRGIIDALWIDGAVAKAVDWKTGKRKPNSDQLALFALLVFAHYPEVQDVRTKFVWLKPGVVDPTETFTRDMIPQLWQLFLQDVKRIEYSIASDVWTPRTSGLCSAWCPVVTCSFNGKRRQGDKL